MACKVTPPNYGLFAKPTPTNSHLKYITFVFDSLGLILDTFLSSTLKIHILFIQRLTNTS